MPVGEVLPPCVTRHVYAGWCGATPLCRPLDMCWLVWSHRLVLPAIYVLVDVVPLACVARYVCAVVVVPTLVVPAIYALGVVVPSPCSACYVFAGW